MFVNSNLHQFVLFYKNITPEQRKYITEKSHFYKCLSLKNKRIFEHRVANFINEHNFYGNGIKVTLEMKTLIAAMAITLTFGMHRYLFSKINTIIIYPKSYYSTILEQYHIGETNPKLHLVVFSWIDFLDGIKNGDDNLNLAIHEFSHALHFSFLKEESFSAINFKNNFNKILRYLKEPENKQKLIDTNYLRSYAFENKYEFLAVLIEHFFETPAIFKQKLPEIFILVQKMLNIDILKIYSKKV
ncbi:zinc-dependent peptidase [Lutibacter sp. B1]|uniref:zinc-dependent peptidase n=1 Tax=Lutibacter sp. B1 TaxID=2725996 RepID=UPI00145683A9|nr:zinc-dependent peptidase [Lutibacter sp. B1]NLP57364.1 zinc-dependent peptidase [Lutibacter sp. B1]